MLTAVPLGTKTEAKTKLFSGKMLSDSYEILRRYIGYRHQNSRNNNNK